MNSKLRLHCKGTSSGCKDAFITAVLIPNVVSYLAYFGMIRGT